MAGGSQPTGQAGARWIARSRARGRIRPTLFGGPGRVEGPARFFPLGVPFRRDRANLAGGRSGVPSPSGV